ncbi:MAG: hypothetical protein IKX15_05125, partial [Spirochaetales bacterium]|nr:hypothetical protein [Spirochaetales bacterium]
MTAEVERAFQAIIEDRPKLPCEKMIDGYGVLFPIFQQESFSFQCMMEKKMFICHPDICRFSDCWSIIV